MWGHRCIYYLDYSTHITLKYLLKEDFKQIIARYKLHYLFTYHLSYLALLTNMWNNIDYKKLLLKTRFSGNKKKTHHTQKETQKL